METHGNIQVWQSQLEALNNEIETAGELEISAKAYELYLESIHRDGLPYDIVCKSIPALESEINGILSQIVDFGISIEMDGKNINLNIVYEDRSWPIELVSGMEKFISNLAIRIGLTNISNMPKTNFFALDEGLGALDADTMASIPTLFSFLKSQFEFVLMITHIAQAKDFADNLIEIKTDKGFSHVSFP